MKVLNWVFGILMLCVIVNTSIAVHDHVYDYTNRGEVMLIGKKFVYVLYQQNERWLYNKENALMTTVLYVDNTGFWHTIALPTESLTIVPDVQLGIPPGNINLDDQRSTN